MILLKKFLPISKNFDSNYDFGIFIYLIHPFVAGISFDWLEIVLRSNYRYIFSELKYFFIKIVDIYTF